MPVEMGTEDMVTWILEVFPVLLGNQGMVWRWCVHSNDHDNSPARVCTHSLPMWT